MCFLQECLNLRIRTERVPVVSEHKQHHGGDALSFSGFSVAHSIENNVLQKHLQHTARLLVDQPRNTLDAPRRARRRIVEVGRSILISIISIPTLVSVLIDTNVKISILKFQFLSFCDLAVFVKMLLLSQSRASSQECCSCSTLLSSPSPVLYRHVTHH